MHVVLIVIVIVFAVVPLCPIVQTTISAEAGIIQGFIVLSLLHIVQNNTAALERTAGLICFFAQKVSIPISKYFGFVYIQIYISVPMYSIVHSINF